MKPRAIILSGYGLNCEDETAFAFERAGAHADIVHINDFVGSSGATAGSGSGRTAELQKYQILVVPGGFSFGDDTGSGKAYAHKMRAVLGNELEKFLARDTLMLGICNGFQILTNMGVLPGALMWNDSGRYQSQWVEVEFTGKSPWLAGLGKMPLPIAHGEGKYFTDQKNPPIIACKYINGNPNGSTQDIAGVLGYNGRVLGMMPHPERAQFPWQNNGQGMQIFNNAVRYFE